MILLEQRIQKSIMKTSIECVIEDDVQLNRKMNQGALFPRGMYALLMFPGVVRVAYSRPHFFKENPWLNCNPHGQYVQ